MEVKHMDELVSKVMDEVMKKIGASRSPPRKKVLRGRPCLQPD